MANINKCLSGRDRARVLLVAQPENPDGSLLDLIKVLEDNSYEGTFCIFWAFSFLFFFFFFLNFFWEKPIEYDS